MSDVTDKNEFAAGLQRLTLMVNTLTQRRIGSGQMGRTFNGQRNIFDSAGYKEILQFDDFNSAYHRGDIGRRIVVANTEETWRICPLIWDGKEDAPDSEILTPFEVAWEDLVSGDKIGDDPITPLSVWHSLALVDRLCGIGRFGILFLGLADGKSPEQPVEKASLSNIDDLLYLQAFDEGSVSIAQIDSNSSSRRFGMPLFYDLSVPNGESGGSQTVRVHWTRCIHIAEGADSNPIFGTPRLEACWNRLVDILKIMAGSGEAAWKLLDPGHILTTKDGKRLPTDSDKLDEIEEQIDEFVNGLRRWLLTDGLETVQIGGQISDPTGLMLANISLISAATGIPQRILLGSERGELASSQDEDNWTKRIETRQALFAGPLIIRPFIQRLIWVGVLPPPDSGIITIFWQKLRREDRQRMVAVADTAASALQKAGIRVDPIEFIKVYLPDLNDKAILNTPDLVPAVQEQEGTGLQEEAPFLWDLTNQSGPFSLSEAKRFSY